MRALRDYIVEQNQGVIVTAIRTLKEELDFDSIAINHLNLAIYLFQTAVNEVLRMHSIKPHWMFALDNLVRNAVQAAITVLSPGNIMVIFLCKVIFLTPSYTLIYYLQKFLIHYLQNSAPIYLVKNAYNPVIKVQKKDLHPVYRP